MKLGYRALFRLEGNDNAVDLAEREIRDWLRGKAKRGRSGLEGTDWEGEGVHRLGSWSKLDVTHLDEPRDSSRRRLYRLTESNRDGDFRVSVYAADQPNSREHAQSIIIEAEMSGEREEDAVREVAPPGLARQLLNAVRARDGRTVLTGEPALAVPGDVQQVVDAITDPDRVASVIVAVSPSRKLDEPWRQVIASLTKRSVGVATAFVVRSDAREQLDTLLPSTHRVGSGRVRTFAPRVALDDPSDSFRHMWLGPATLARSISRGMRVAEPLQRRHAESTRRRLVELALPSDARRTLDLLRREESRVLRAARVETKIGVRLEQLEPVPPAVDTSTHDRPGTSPQVQPEIPKVSWIQRARATIKRWLDIAEPSDEAFERLDRLISEKDAEVETANEQLDEAATADAQMRQELEDARERLQELGLELAIAEGEEQRARNEASTLRQRIARGDVIPQDAYVEAVVPDWEAPTSVEELVQRITPGEQSHVALQHVEFTGSEELAIEVDQRDQGTGRYAQRFWEYIRVLHDYAQQRTSGEFQGSVHMYLTDDGATGAKCPPDRHASSESDSVLNNAKWRKERELPVPERVDESGRVLMKAHFKPTHSDTFAPRMHYYDDVDGSGKVYIGYIGRHLTNTRT